LTILWIDPAVSLESNSWSKLNKELSTMETDTYRVEGGFFIQ